LSEDSEVKSKVLTVLTPFFLGAFLVGQAGASIITFDDVGDKVTITNQYSGVIFSSSGLDVVMTTSQNPPYTGTVPNLICTGQAMPIGTVDCSHDLTLDFASPVDNLKFDAFGNQSAVGTSFAQADIYQNGVLTQPNLDLLVSHTSHTAGCPGDPSSPAFTPDCIPDPQDFSAYAGITKLVIHSNTDTQGTAYDNFSFAPQQGETTDPTPEPSSLFLAGIGGIIWAGSRRLLARKSL
jgi:hypothetical protein